MRICERRSIISFKMVVLFAMAMCTACMYSCSDLQDPVGTGDGVEEIRPMIDAAMDGASGEKWTFLLYIAADVPQMIDPFEYFAAQLFSNDNLDVLILDDRSGETAKIFFVDENHNAVLREDIGEVNTGSPATLAYFLDYGETSCPADRYIVTFYGHGGAWSGACPDLDPGFDVLRMDDFKQALSDFGGVDIVLFTACTMGALESAYELRGCTDVYIANENLAVFLYWSKVLASISSELELNPGVSTHELGRLIIEWMEKDRKGHSQFGYIQYWSSSAIRTDRLSPLKDAVDDLALGYMADPARFYALVESVRNKMPYFASSSSVDLNTTMMLLYGKETDPAMKMKIESVVQCLSEAIIAESHFMRYRNLKGMSIFLPDEAAAGDLPYYVHPIFGLDFVLDTNWDELLAAIFSATKAGAAAGAVQRSVCPERYFESPGM